MKLPFINSKNKKPRTAQLETPFEKDLQEIPFSEYPRPQLKRDSYLCLNGEWDFEIRNKNGNSKYQKIVVPFPPESKISGICQNIDKNDLLIYTKEFTLPDGFIKDRVIINFGAADQFTKVYINDKLVGENIGGYLPFSFDITDHIKRGNNTVRAEVSDPLDIELCYGKQTYKRGGMWYTKISGIWQTVWLESVPKNHIENIKITPSLDSVKIEVFGGKTDKTIILENKNYSFTGDSIQIDIEDPKLWTPETPNLYYFTLKSGDDEIQSYFALRTVEAGKKRLLLNGKPYFFHGLLDQGYFSDGIFLPSTEQGFKNDILQMKACGFNMLRKHIKLEPDLFYYYCDKYGMAVFQDMINSGKYGFIIDTALPTVFLKRGVRHRVTKRRKEEFYRTSEGIINFLYNHPSVCYYTIFNEGWGQFNADRCYLDFNALDPTRIYDSTSGWFKEKLSDVESEHIYFKPIKLKSKYSRPVVLSEFGGFSCKVKDHSFNLDKNTGYSFFTDDVKEFEKRIIRLYDEEVIPAIEKGLSATVLTQLSDVEDETNGMMTYNRAVIKVESDSMKAMSDRIYSKFKEVTEKE